MKKVDFYLARILTSLPLSWQSVLARSQPAVVAGERLHPETQLLLALRKLKKEKAFFELGVEGSRKMMRQSSALFGGTELEIDRVEECKIPSGSVILNGRHYFPKSQTRGMGLMVFYHGGGFVFGDLDTHDTVCRIFCKELGLQVVSVEYRLAPEFVFPAAIEDGLATYQWALKNAAVWGVDPARIIIAGDSAGGNIAAVVAQMARDQNLIPPQLQVLIYPATDRTKSYPSQSHFSDGYLITGKDIQWFNQLYANEVATDDPRISPIRAKTLAGLAPAFVVTAAFDPLRDEGEAYATALTDAGVKVQLLRVDGMVHGFIHALEYGKAARVSFYEVIQALKSSLIV